MPQKIYSKRVLLAKAESTYGTDPTPTGSANAMLVKNMTFTPMEAELIERGTIRPYIGGYEQYVANNHAMIEFEVEMMGSGAAGTAPAYAPLLLACGFAETVTASTKVEYTPVSSSFGSCTLYFNIDGVLHKITGARGNLEMDISARQIPVFKFRFVGIYNAPTDTSAPTPVYTGFMQPLVANNTNTTGFSFFGVSSLVLESMKINMNNENNFRALIGSESVIITNRKANGELVFEAPTLATLDVFATAVGTTNGALSITHGTVSGYKVKIDATNVDVGNPTYSDGNGVVMAQVPIFLPPSSGNDEIKITIL